MMRKYFLCLTILTCCLSAQAQPYSTGIDDCKRKTGCRANNDARFRNNTLTGARVEFSYVQCSSNTDAGDSVEVCINSDPIKPPNQRVTDCSFECQEHSFGWSYTTSAGEIVVGSTACNSCPSPTPSPSPSPSPEPYECDPLLPAYCWEVLCTEVSPYDCNTCAPTYPGECASPQAGCNCSPIVIDIDGDGFDFVSASEGVIFDLNGDGLRQSRLSWTSANTDDAWLVLDRDQDGFIESGAEMFGNYTPQPDVPDKHGFLALAEFDKIENGGNEDGKINRLDDVFGKLRLWQDKNHNGVSEASELHRLRSLGLAAIDLDYETSRRRDRHGNRFKYRAKVRDVNGAQLGRWAWDVFLVAESLNSQNSLVPNLKIFSIARTNCARNTLSYRAYSR